MKNDRFSIKERFGLSDELHVCLSVYLSAMKILITNVGLFGGIILELATSFIVTSDNCSLATFYCLNLMTVKVEKSNFVVVIVVISAEKVVFM